MKLVPLTRGCVLARVLFSWALVAVLPAAAQTSPALRLKSGATTGTAVVVSREAAPGPSDELWLLTAYHNVVAQQAVTVEDAFGESRALSEIGEGAPCLIASLDVFALRVSASGAAWLTARVKPARLSSTLPSTDLGTYALGNPKLRILGQDRYPYDYRTEGGLGARRPAGSVLPASALSTAVADKDLVLLNDFTITYGFSGGPVLAKGDAQQTLVGIVQGGDPTTKKIAWATPADLIADALAAQPSACAELPAGTAWPKQGFHSSVYGAIDSQARIAVDDYRPNPLTFVRGTAKPVSIRVLIAGAHDGGMRGTGYEITIDPQPVPGIERTAGLRVGRMQDGFVTFTYVFTVTSGFEGRDAELPFTLRTQNGRELDTFTIEGEVERDDYVELQAQAGLDYDPGASLFIPHAALGVGIEFDLAGSGVTLIPVFAIGIANLRVDRLTFDPVGERLQTRELSAWGPHLQLSCELRLLRREGFAPRFALGAVGDVFSFDDARGVDRMRIAFPLQISGAIQLRRWSLVPYVRAAIERAPGVDYRYLSLLARDTQPGAWHASFGLGLGGAYDIPR